MPSNSRKQLEEWLKTICVDTNKVLDIGGSQLPMKGRTKKWKVNEYAILDIEEPHECKKKPDVVGNIESNDFNVHIPDNLYDVVFCIEVSEYWIEPSIAINNIFRVMKKGGFLYISYHSTYPLHKPTGADCLRYTYYGIEKLLNEAGFEIVEHKLRKIYPKREITLLNLYLEEFKPDKNDIEKVLSSGGMIKAIKKI